MISNKLIQKHNVVNVWSSSQKEDNDIGFKRAFIGECVDGKWLVVTTDELWEVSEVLIVGSRAMAMKRIRERVFWTRVRKLKLEAS